MIPPVMQMRGVSKAYPDDKGRPRPVLERVSLSLAPGEALGLVGPSGAGKSTLARLALGVERPDQGSVLVKGKDIERIFARARRRLMREVQIIWQDPTVYLNPFQPVLRSIAEPLEAFELAHGSRARARGLELMALVGLSPDLAGRLPRELSGGQCQRVGIARALALAPSVLICDEALVSLDLPAQVRTLHLLSRLRDELGLSLLFISHDEDLVGKLCARCLRLEQGGLREA